jgi:hypothetical protein
LGINLPAYLLRSLPNYLLKIQEALVVAKTDLVFLKAKAVIRKFERWLKILQNRWLELIILT